MRSQQNLKTKNLLINDDTDAPIDIHSGSLYNEASSFLPIITADLEMQIINDKNVNSTR